MNECSNLNFHFLQDAVCTARNILDVVWDRNFLSDLMLIVGLPTGATFLVCNHLNRPARLSGKDMDLSSGGHRKIARFAARLVDAQSAVIGPLSGEVAVEAIQALRNEINVRLLYRAGEEFAPELRLARGCGDLEYGLASLLADMYEGEVLVPGNQVIRSGKTAEDIVRSGGVLDQRLKITRPRRVRISPTTCFAPAKARAPSTQRSGTTSAP